MIEEVIEPVVEAAIESTEKELSKTKLRLKVIESLIEAHQQNINELQTCLEANKVVVSGPYPRRIDKPGYITVWARDFHWTIRNLKNQIYLLEKEHSILIEYGA